MANFISSVSPTDFYVALNPLPAGPAGSGNFAAFAYTCTRKVYLAVLPGAAFFRSLLPLVYLALHSDYDPSLLSTGYLTMDTSNRRSQAGKGGGPSLRLSIFFYVLAYMGYCLV